MLEIYLHMRSGIDGFCTFVPAGQLSDLIISTCLWLCSRSNFLLYRLGDLVAK